MAAGLGFKTFTTGEVLTAADTNGYLMQGVLVFASAAARNAAITSPQEGQFAYTKDTNGLWYYDGAAWVASGATGDIEGVTAGVGITGGGTSGTVTITNDMATTITAAGDIVVGTGSGTYDNLPIGTTAQVLTADTTVSPYKVKWATPAGGGKVLQVVMATSSTRVDNSTTTYADTGLTANITPSAASSKVLVLLAIADLTPTTGNAVDTRLMRGATAIATTGTTTGYSTGGYNVMNLCHNYLDSPSTTSSTTYKAQFRSSNTDQVSVMRNASLGTIILLEIGA
jgi:hypothetical protein